MCNAASWLSHISNELKTRTFMTNVITTVISLGLLLFAFESSLWATDADRPPAPSEAEQAEKLRLVTELYKLDYEKAKSAEMQKTLAEKMFKQAQATANDPVGKFVLLRVSRDIAAKAGDWQLALTILDQVLADYALAEDPSGHRHKGLMLKQDLLREASRGTTTREQRSAITQAAMTLGDTASKDMFFDVAQGCHEFALELARRNRDGAQVRMAVEKLDATKSVAAEYEKVKSALEVLEKRPTDEAANLTAGRFYCFIVNDWSKGVPMLALGNDSGLRDVATKELEGPADASALLAVADAWWEIADQHEGQVTINIRRHAGVWYQQAAPGLEGLAQVKAKKRIEEIGTIAAGDPITAHAAIPMLKNEWHVVFRSSDPTLWGKDKSDENSFSVALEDFPKEIQFLRLKRMDTGEFLIIPMTNEALNGGPIGTRLHWCRHTDPKFRSQHLGLADVGRPPTQRRKDPFVTNGPNESRGKGWGFGSRYWDERGAGVVYQWNGVQIKPTAFEIAVLSGKLPNDQMRLLLR
jgi:hypothetical protein